MATTSKDKKKTATKTRRPWTPASLYKNLDAYMRAEGLKAEEPISVVLDALKESIVESQIG